MRKSILLGVNIDHVATLREARGTVYPDPVEAALIAEKSGADSITAHLREDRRHIKDHDMMLLKEKIKIRLNFEMAVTDEMVRIASHIQPAACCLVPEKREELTTEGGLDVLSNISKIGTAYEKLSASNIEVSLFIDPEEAQIDAAFKIGVPVIELHTGIYADAKTEKQYIEALNRIKSAANYANNLGLDVNAGHGLTINNVKEICKIPEIIELNIGHSIISRAIFFGLGGAVREIKSIIVSNSRLTVEN